MYEYSISDEDIDKVVNKTYKYLKSKDNRRSFEQLGYDICNEYTVSLTPKQKNIIGRIYYSKVHEYKKPTKKMIADAMKAEAFRVALNDVINNRSSEYLFNILHPEGTDKEEHY